jgi:glycosyltransferase involved in cell wall biosynthesis
MKIAIVAPCPVPYMVGGAEKLWWGLAAHFNEHTAHQAEIIKLPTPEHDLVSLIRGYEAFSTLDLGAFDVVVSGKYPAWMVWHPRHICYMLHRLRGLYDCYPGAIEVGAELANHPAVGSLRAYMRRFREGRNVLPEFFGRWNEIVAGGARPAGLTDFPGPLAREIVHWLDGVGLAPSSITRYAAISATVAGRPGYFPEGVEVAVAHPPPHRAGQPGGERKHFFTVSRLDAPKRMGLVVEAMRLVKTDLPLLVAGPGPEEAALREIAGGDDRIRLLGFQSDAEVAGHYRDALAVPFAPYAEDYGLIAVEAMQCARPVVTTNDSGGPCELVEDGVNGLVCDPTAPAMAAALQRLADDRGLAIALGEKARERAARVDWATVAQTLLAVPRHGGARPHATSRRKLLLGSTFSIFPPRHGGQSRIYHLYRALAPEFETVVVSICPSAEPPFIGEVAPGLREVRIPMSREHERRTLKAQAEAGTPVTDVVMPELLTPELHAALRNEAQGACAVIASHPYLYPALAGLGLPLWYEAHNLELHLKTALLKDLPGGERLIEAVAAVEKASVRAAELILCSSPDDADELVRLFGARRESIVDVPNGTDAQRITFAERAEREALKERLGIAANPLVLFLGSGHWPNIEAVKKVFEFATALPHAAFAVVGSVCYAFDPRLKPANVLFVGEVDEVTRNLCMQASDVAVNPMEHGSGTNLKMLDFFAAGLPVITTHRGSRGLRLDGESQCLVREIEDFPDAIELVAGAGAQDAARRALAARRLVEREFDWGAIAERIKPRLIAAADAARGPAGRGIAEAAR